MTPANPQAQDSPQIVCHAPGERCLGCAHYHGKAPVCEYAPASVRDEAAPFALSDLVCDGHQLANQAMLTADERETVAKLAAALEAQQAEITRLQAKSVSLWECPDCCFGFDARHTDEDGGHTCPSCAEDRLSIEIARLREKLKRYEGMPPQFASGGSLERSKP